MSWRRIAGRPGASRYGRRRRQPVPPPPVLFRGRQIEGSSIVEWGDETREDGLYQPEADGTARCVPVREPSPAGWGKPLIRVAVGALDWCCGRVASSLSPFCPRFYHFRRTGHTFRLIAWLKPKSAVSRITSKFKDTHRPIINPVLQAPASNPPGGHFGPCAARAGTPPHRPTRPASVPLPTAFKPQQGALHGTERTKHHTTPVAGQQIPANHSVTSPPYPSAI